MNLWMTATLCAALALSTQAQTLPPQPLRDPTLAPAGIGPGGVGEGLVPGTELPLQLNGANVVVRNGKPMLVVGSRLVAPGQTVESYRLERITETEIWLRDASGITKVPRFAGVQRRSTVSQCPAAKAAAVPKKSLKKQTPPPVHNGAPPSPKTGTAVPRPTRENDLHDC